MKATPPEVRAAGFSVIGEELAIDLANTVKHAASPARDLLVDAGNADFWRLERDRLPAPAVPSREASASLRSAIRSLLEARMADEPAPLWAVEVVNSVAAAAVSTATLSENWSSDETLAATDDDSRVLSAVARNAIQFLSSAESSRLRQCGSSTCSMLFVASHAKRLWCSPECGNRQRVRRFAAKNASA